MNSVRRGTGSDVAGARPYRRGDDARAIDWNASARLSSAHGADEFLVREYFAEEAPRVVLLCDRRPAMALFPPPLPWLAKPLALRHAFELVAEATAAVRGLLGYLDHGRDGAKWEAPRLGRRALEGARDVAFDGREDSLARAIEFLARLQPRLAPETFIFILSDFLVPVEDESWLALLDRRWDVVPVVIQDPVWELSFPDIGGVMVPFHDQATGRLISVRLSARETARRREEHESRTESLLTRFRALDLTPVLISTSDRDSIFSSFLDWADERVWMRGHSW
jgi:uncharacterized protein (DUF58 family)